MCFLSINITQKAVKITYPLLQIQKQNKKLQTKKKYIAKGRDAMQKGRASEVGCCRFVSFPFTSEFQFV